MESDVNKDFEETFVSLLTSHHDRLLRFVRTLMPHSADAEDVFQRATVSLWKKHKEYDTDQPFFPWACRFLHYEVLNHRKKIARERLTFSEDLISILAEETVTEQSMLEQRSKALEFCLEKLQESDRRILQRRYAESGSVASLAEDLGITPRKLYKSLEILKKKLSLCLDRALTSNPSQLS